MADSGWKFDEDESEDGKVYFVLLNDPAMPRLLSKIWVFQQKFYQLTNLSAATSYKEEENSSVYKQLNTLPQDYYFPEKPATH